MSADDHRNTLIVELSNRTNQPVAHFQALGDAELEGRGATLVCLREAGIRTDAQLKTMSDDDRRNTLIAEIKAFNIFFDLNHLQAVSDLDLVLTLLGKDHLGRSADNRPFAFIGGILLAGRFRTHVELARMDQEARRNTLIVELAGRTNQPVAHFQALDDAALAGKGAIMVYLREGKIRTDAQLKSISDDDQRNIAITVIHDQTSLPVSQLQGLNNLSLVTLALGSFSSLLDDCYRCSLIRGVLLMGRFRTQAALNRMSRNEQRDTLIVELAGRTGQSVAHYQALNDDELAGRGAVFVYLREARIRTDPELKAMSDSDQRNTLIVVLREQTNLPIAKLQSLSDIDLVITGLGAESAFIRGVLLAGHFRTQDELNGMSPSGHRNTLIVILNGLSNRPVAHYQSLDDAALAGSGAVLVYLREAAIRTDAQLKTMSDDDQRNLLIVILGAQTNLDGPLLQGLTNLDLVRAGLGALSAFSWEDDPNPPPPGTLFATLSRDYLPIPDLTIQPLAVRITDVGSAPAHYVPGTAEFRYWVAANALARATTFWRGIEGAGNPWQLPESALPVHLNADTGLNASYARDAGAGIKPGLCFLSQNVDGVTYFAGESPDVICHECGHAVLDALRPDLWSSGYDEVAAFHESFGDLSSIFSLLQLDFIRSDLIATTGGRLYQNSRVSRVAEQLGFAIRQHSPGKAEADCLRNAFNNFTLFEDTASLPVSAPASELSREPHSLCRVFTSAIFEVLAGAFALEGGAQGPVELLAATRKVATLLIAALRTAANVPRFFSQVALQMLLVDEVRFGSRYAAVLGSAFASRSILFVIIAVPVPSPSFAAKTNVLASGPPVPSGESRIAVDLSAYGLHRSIIVRAPEVTPRSLVTNASARRAYQAGMSPSLERQQAVRSFVGDLLQLGNIDFSQVERPSIPGARKQSRPTHYVVEAADGLELRRRYFD